MWVRFIHYSIPLTEVEHGNLHMQMDIIIKRESMQTALINRSYRKIIYKIFHILQGVLIISHFIESNMKQMAVSTLKTSKINIYFIRHSSYLSQAFV